MKNLLFKISLFLLITTNAFCQTDIEKEKEGFVVTVNSKFFEAIMTKDEFKNAKFGIHSFNPEMAGKFGLKKFTVKYPGQKPIVNEGDKLNEQAAEGLMKLKNGDQIIVYDATTDNKGNYIVEVYGPMIITIK